MNSYLTYPVRKIFEDIEDKSGFDFLNFPDIGNKYYFFDPNLTFETRLHKRLSYLNYETREEPFICSMWNRGALNTIPEQARQFKARMSSSVAGASDSFTIKNVKCQLNLVFVSNDPDYLTSFEEFFIIKYDRSITLESTYKVPFNFKEIGNISNVNQGTKTFTVGGNVDYLVSGDSLTLLDSTGNDGDYTVSSIDINLKEIVVNEVIPDSTADGILVKNGFLEDIPANIFFDGIEFSDLNKLDTDSRGELVFLLVTMNIQYPVVLNDNYVGNILSSNKLIKHIQFKTKEVKTIPEFSIPEQLIGDIIAVNRGTKTFTLSGNVKSKLGVEDIIRVKDSTGNDGLYTAVSINLSGINTDMEVSEIIPNIIGDGELCRTKMTEPYDGIIIE